MKKFLENSKEVMRYILFAGFALIIYYFIPKQGKFKYEFKKHEIWQHEDLISPFSFPINKSDDEIEQEKNEIKLRFKPYFQKNTTISEDAEKKFRKDFSIYLLVDPINLDIEAETYILKEGVRLIRTTYDAGIIDLKHNEPSSNQMIRLIFPDKTTKEYGIDKFIDIDQINDVVKEKIHSDTLLSKYINISEILKLFTQDVYYDKELSVIKLNEELSQISLSKGLIQEGEKIISKGVKVTPEKYQILDSLRKEYESQLSEKKSTYYMYAGYFILIILITVIFAVYIGMFYRNIYNSIKDLILILVTILIFVLISTYVARTETISIYLIPFCIVPIIFISFYEARIAFISHLLTILIVSLFAPNGFEFLFIQTLAGLFLIVSLSRVRYLSQFFLSVLLIFLVYYLSYFGIKLIQSTSFKEIDYINFLWFTGSFILTLLAYPLLYAYEKIFGLLSDITLIELSDLNKKLLKDLSTKAPGTFQHSIQVAKLTEAVLAKIGGNALLAKVGALYHDIGKMFAPQYFTENQKDYNPHNDLDEKESAKIIISHVTKGVELAQKNNIPKEIINFIKTHHGTTRTEFFYRSYIKKHPDEVIDDSMFRYPGPKPSTKEMAVVMIVDTVEAASRSLKKTSPEIIEELVDNLVESKLADNQFQLANISIKEIRIAKDVLKNSLKSIYHNRIEYPKEE